MTRTSSNVHPLYRPIESFNGWKMSICYRNPNQRFAAFKPFIEEMRNKGASRRSLYAAVKGFYEYVKITGTDIHS